MQSRYEWKNGPAEIDQHSIAKHKILESYLAAYFKTLVGNQPRDEFKLTLVDGFAGGGLYKHSNTAEVIKGSPFILLDSEKIADFNINQNRTKKVKLDISYFFIEKDKNTYNFLINQLSEKNYKDKFNKNIFVFNSSFEEKCNDIINFIKKKSPRNGRSIFILDQFGFSDVPFPLIRKILSELNSSEIILTFGVDSLLTYANPEIFKNFENKAGLPSILKDKPIEEIKKSNKDWRLFLQSIIYNTLIKEASASFYTPFFIRNSGGHGDYWLIHLSQHPKARDVMTEVHWNTQNNFIHYAGPGLDMFNLLGYDPNFDSQFLQQNTLGFEFDNHARQLSINKITEQLPKLIRTQSEIITFDQIYSLTCNNSPATNEIYRQALVNLVHEKEIEIISDKNEYRKSPNQIKSSDFIILPRQKSIFTK